jgi:hypothetical protein
VALGRSTRLRGDEKERRWVHALRRFILPREGVVNDFDALARLGISGNDCIRSV